MLWSLSFAAIANTFHVKVLRRPVESALEVAGGEEVVGEGVEHIVERGAVLGDQQVPRAVLAVQAHQQVRQALGVHLPVHVRVPGALRPGLYVYVTLKIPRSEPAIVVPAEALIFDSDGLRVATVEDHLAGGGREQPRQRPQQGRLTGARRSHDGHGFAVAHRQTDAFEDPLLGQLIDQTLAEMVLKDIISDPAGEEITTSLIMAQTADYFGITIDDLCSANRSRTMVSARHIAMYLCRELTDMSLPNIGKQFGGRDHTTVMHAERKIRELMGERRAIYNQVTELTNRIKQQAG